MDLSRNAKGRRLLPVLLVSLMVAAACGTGGAGVTIVVMPGGPTTLTLTPTDDATIRPDSKANNNYGSASDLLVDLSSRKDFLLRFDINGIGTANVLNATLRLRATDSSGSGGDFTYSTDTDWNQDTVTWNTAPPADGNQLGSLGSVTAGNWYELDLTGHIDSDGPITIRVASTSNNGADYASTENPANLAPELIILIQ